MEYLEFRKNCNISDSSIKSELLVINQFENFLNKKYKKKIEPFEITSADVKEFLKQQLLINKPITVNKKLVYLKSWFNYLWKSGEISYDYVCKIQALPIENNTNINTGIHSYKDMLKFTPEIAKANISITAKLIFIFYLKGIQPRNLFNIRVSNIRDLNTEIEITGTTLNDKNFRLLFKDRYELNIIREGIERTIFGNTDFLFNSKKRGDNDLSKIIQENISEHIQAINEIINMKFTFTLCKSLYIEYLFKEEKMRIEEIANLLATTIESVTNHLNNLLDLSKSTCYNVV